MPHLLITQLRSLITLCVVKQFWLPHKIVLNLKQTVWQGRTVVIHCPEAWADVHNRCGTNIISVLMIVFEWWWRSAVVYKVCWELWGLKTVIYLLLFLLIYSLDSVCLCKSGDTTKCRNTEAMIWCIAIFSVSFLYHGSTFALWVHRRFLAILWNIAKNKLKHIPPLLRGWSCNATIAIGEGLLNIYL